MRGIIDICKSTELAQDEILFVIESYIEEKKGVSVNIDITPRNALELMSANRTLQLMNIAFESAAKYYLNK